MKQEQYSKQTTRMKHKKQVSQGKSIAIIFPEIMGKKINNRIHIGQVFKTANKFVLHTQGI